MPTPERLLPFKDLHAGERCFVLASGPSLARIPRDLLSRLADEKTFVLSSTSKWDGLPFEPTYYFGQEIQYWATFNQILNELGWTCPRFHADRFVPELPEPWIIIKVGEGKLQYGDFSGLDGELEDLAARGGSATLLVAQLACYMGFRTIYLLGCDVSDGYVWDPTLKRDAYSKYQFYVCSSLVAQLLAQHGRQLIDLTEDGGLDLPKGSLAEVLGAVH